MHLIRLALAVFAFGTEPDGGWFVAIPDGRGRYSGMAWCAEHRAIEPVTVDLVPSTDR